MPKRGSSVYSLTLLKRLWADGKTHQEIAAALGCSEMYVSQLRERHKLPRRRQVRHGPQEFDPTPEQIAERAAECRARRPDPATPKEERVSMPRYTWTGVGFRALT
jgi:hypothetical protein